MTVYKDVGVHAATISAIAKQSGLGKGTIYLYFESKEALTIALVERYFDRLTARLMSNVSFASLDEFLKHLCKNMDVSKEHASFIRVFFEVFGPSFAADDFVVSISTFFDKLGGYYADKIVDLQKLGEISPLVRPAVAGRALASMVDGMILHKGFFGIPVRRHRAMIEDAVRLLGEGLRATPR